MDKITMLVYLIAAILFILGLKNLSSPKTARRGNRLSMLGMFLAVVMTAFKIIDPVYVLIGLVIGSAIGAISAKRVQMTAMPQMVAIFNGFGGGASTLVAFSEYLSLNSGYQTLDFSITVVLSILVGTVTFFGSMIAFAKLEGIMRGSPITFKGQQLVNAVLLSFILIIGAFFVMALGGVSIFSQIPPWAYLIIIAILSMILGVTSVIPIGGADMPVVISLLNSYSGLAAAFTGFVLSNYVLIISGALVGASGLILTNIMCKAMNRSLTNVLFAAVGKEAGSSTQGEQRTVTRYTGTDAAVMLENAQSIIIIPGYGLAVAQAQHVLHEMATLLMERGKDVKYAIHPVAGRMPGHMNVLMAEANVPYDYLYEMDEINDDFQHTDVALVIGANDVINPAARYKKDSALYGMPILNADKANTIMIIKRSLGAGFAGEQNELFYDPKTMMVFGDAKKMLMEIVNNLKA
ncbi:NAD(P)(+) transhydrogenase (Re/Si-specific) subunit beta [candidate division KSB1 bacterium]|nr:NAD(P)(+) transhydrogenase (Re/Si-specific) subunit beta [candidate division KSB1 bacterium]